ncbi:hypothetical protein EDD16DRAFT_1572390 [Pisolithus croceorrhizus]|nr:hypothetical protein EDD16DRAFT_1572390 [Pisolithus croceorrhizus]
MGGHCARDVPVGFRWPFVTPIPFDNFILTNIGELVQYQITMFRERIRTVGISLLGGNSGTYDLAFHSVRTFNEEDVTMPLCECVP